MNIVSKLIVDSFPKILPPRLPRLMKIVPKRFFSEESDCRYETGEVYSCSNEGIRYRILKEGFGDYPEKGDYVRVHHKGRFFDGTRIQNGDSYKIGIPLSFRVGLGNVIKAWDISILDMSQGEKRKIIVPPKFGYGEKGTDFIPPNTPLIYELELVFITKYSEAKQPYSREDIMNSEEFKMKSAQGAEKIEEIKRMFGNIDVINSQEQLNKLFGDEKDN